MRTRLTHIIDGEIRVINDIAEPPERLQRMIDVAIDKFQIHNVEFYCKLHDYLWPPDFAGVACRTGDNTYAVCISGYKLDQYDKYMKWVIEHELRHCMPKNKTTNFQLEGLQFRKHDVQLTDTGFKPASAIGFFWEDFEDIKCCDELMYVFQNIEGIEEYL